MKGAFSTTFVAALSGLLAPLGVQGLEAWQENWGPLTSTISSRSVQNYSYKIRDITDLD